MNVLRYINLEHKSRIYTLVLTCSLWRLIYIFGRPQINILDCAGSVVRPSQVVRLNQFMHPSRVVHSSQVVFVTHFQGNWLYHVAALSAAVFYPER